MAPWTTWKMKNLCLRGIRKLPPKSSLMPISLAFVTSFVVLLYLSSHLDMICTSSLHGKCPTPLSSSTPFFKVLKYSNKDGLFLSGLISSTNKSRVISAISLNKLQDHDAGARNHEEDDDLHHHDEFHGNSYDASKPLMAIGTPTRSFKSKPNNHRSQDVFHDNEIFLQNYKEMKRSLKIYIYPPKKKDPFANLLLPKNDTTPGGNYASEAYFKNVLYKSHFVTKNPLEADLFFLPFSIASLRYDRRVGVGGLQEFLRQYMVTIARDYPYWNRTGGADHFYVACHSVGRMAMDKVELVKANAIQVICSSSYFLANYFAHKDVCLPQIWPRHEEPGNLATSQRKTLAFFAGAMNSPVRKQLLQAWKNDSSIFAHEGRLHTPYSEQLIRSKYCLHLKGFEVNTARVVDALYYGCVPVILADYYDLPFMDILNWRSFSVVVTTSDIPYLKRILQGISPEEYYVLQANVLEVRKHFQWNANPLDFDAFYMVMYELWLRRSCVRILS